MTFFPRNFSLWASKEKLDQSCLVRLDESLQACDGLNKNFSKAFTCGIMHYFNNFYENFNLQVSCFIEENFFHD